MLEMDGGECNFSSLSLTSSTTSMEQQMMSPKSPLPGLVDFHGKRKQMVKIQILEREISLLQEELKSLEGLHPASRCCKELDTFVDSVSDPFTLRGKHNISESHKFWKHISFPWICCSCSCVLQRKMAKGCCCCLCCPSSKSKFSGCSCFKPSSTVSKIVAKF